MELETVQKDDRLIIDMKQNHTLANLIRKAVWEVGGEAAYDKGHPLGDESQLIVSEGDKELLQEAADQAREWLEDIEKQL